MKCAEAKKLFSPCLDAVAEGKQIHALNLHLAECAQCWKEFAMLRATQQVMGSLGPKPVPPDLALKLKVALSQEIAASKRGRLEGLGIRFQNAFNAFMVPATAGALTSIIIFGLLIGILIPRQISGADVPTMLYTPPQLASAPFGMEIGALNGDALLVEAYVDANGRVEDYRVLNAPANEREVLSELKNLLIFSQFHPATSFGQPVSGRVVLSFSKINVQG